MASKFNVGGLTLNAQEVTDVSAFVIERVFSDPVLSAIHSIWTGVQMKEQIIFASQLGKTGIKDTACTRPNSGAVSTLTQKYWEPAKVGDTMEHCNTDLNALFKAYYGKVMQYRELFEIEGSDLAQFLMTLTSEAAMQAIWRIVWNADLNVAASQAAVAGLIDGVNNTKFYDHIDGLWAQIFDGVTGGSIAHTTVKVAALNALIVPANQVALAAGDSVAVFEDMWQKADSRLRSDMNAQFLVSRELFENYRQYLQTKGENSTIGYTMEGFPSLMWNGRKVVNMENVWDLFLRADFEQDSTNHAYWLPNRAVLTVPANIPIATLNEADMSEMDFWYDKDTRLNKLAYGFTLDAKVLEGYMIVAAY